MLYSGGTAELRGHVHFPFSLIVTQSPRTRISHKSRGSFVTRPKFNKWLHTISTGTTDLFTKMWHLYIYRIYSYIYNAELSLYACMDIGNKTLISSLPTRGSCTIYLLRSQS